MKDPLAVDTLLHNERYRIVRHLKTGAQAIVYEAFDQNLHHPVVVKQTYQDEDWAHEAFRQEARLLARLRHKSLPQISNHFIEGGSAFLVMSFIVGSDLSDKVRGFGAFPPEEVLDVAMQLFDVVEYLHSTESGVIHRDINPRNIRITERGQVYLLDFGIAKDMTSVTHIFGGSPHYAPPEQLKDERTDARSDLFSLGATLYYLLTAIPPPVALSREAAILKGQTDPLISADVLDRRVPPAIATVLTRAMSLSPEQRPRTAAVMRLEFKAAVSTVGQDVPSVGHNESEANPNVPEIGFRPTSTIVVEIGRTENVLDQSYGGAEKLVEALKNGLELPSSLMHFVIDLLDTPVGERSKVVMRHYSTWDSIKEVQFDDATGLIRQLIAGADLPTRVVQELRQKLAEGIAVELGSTSDGSDGHATIATHRVLLWVVRGVISTILIGSPVLFFLHRSKSLPLPVLLSLHLTVLLFLLRTSSRRRRKHSLGSEKPGSASCLAFIFGGLVGFLLLYDLILLLTS